MKNGEIVQRDVIEELAWDPQVDSSHIAVTVSDGGIVRLDGSVGSYAERLAAEKAALRIAGVRAVADDLEVKLYPGLLLGDESIAKAAADAIRFNVSVPKDAVTVTVAKGWITLGGEVQWNYQKQAATKAVRFLYGVKGVLNDITIKTTVDKVDIKQRIEAAYKRSAQIDSEHVKVAVHDGKVTLSGTVSSWAERVQAEDAAWSAPGVRSVKNDISIEAPVRAW
jgi:osmotically-inducible protein OsmY